MDEKVQVRIEVSKQFHEILRKVAPLYNRTIEAFVLEATVNALSALAQEPVSEFLGLAEAFAYDEQLAQIASA